mgnify:FL=1
MTQGRRAERLIASVMVDTGLIGLRRLTAPSLVAPACNAKDMAHIAKHRRLSIRYNADL